MKLNVGGIDKTLRIVAGLVLIGLAIAGIGAPWTWIGIVPLATGVIGFCPFYPLLGMNTCPAKRT
jgi:membrane protein implicated in regulation of membrane protease activity